jgi:hypothetical protein
VTERERDTEKGVAAVVWGGSTKDMVEEYLFMCSLLHDVHEMNA